MFISFVGDCHVPIACQRFVELHGKKLLHKNLYRNFCLHLTNLFDFGLLTRKGVCDIMKLLNAQIVTTTAKNLLY